MRASLGIKTMVTDVNRVFLDPFTETSGKPRLSRLRPDVLRQLLYFDFITLFLNFNSYESCGNRVTLKVPLNMFNMLPGFVSHLLLFTKQLCLSHRW